MWRCECNRQKSYGKTVINVIADSKYEAYLKAFIYFGPKITGLYSDLAFILMHGELLNYAEIQDVRQYALYDIFKTFKYANEIMKRKNIDIESYITLKPRGDYYQFDKFYISEKALDIFIKFQHLIHISRIDEIEIEEIPLKVNVTKELFFI